MLDTGKDNRSPAAPARTSENSLGLKGFNQVGTEEGHLEILKPQGDPAHRRKTVALLSVVVLLLGVIAALAFRPLPSLVPPRKRATTAWLRPFEWQ